MNPVVIFTSAGILTLLSFGISGVSGFLSFQGYGAAFPDIFGASYIGALIAALAVAASWGLGIVTRQGSSRGIAVGIAVVILAALGDMTGNGLSLAGKVNEKVAAYERSIAAYNRSVDDLATARTRLQNARADLEAVLDDDAKAVQRFLMAKGLYTGKIDGVIGPLSRNAIAGLSTELRETIRIEEGNERAAKAVIDLGKPTASPEGEGLRAIVISVVLTLVSLLASFFASIIATGGRGIMAELKAIEDDFQAIEEDALDLARYVYEARNAERGSLELAEAA